MDKSHFFTNLFTVTSSVLLNLGFLELLIKNLIYLWTEVVFQIFCQYIFVNICWLCIHLLINKLKDDSSII